MDNKVLGNFFIKKRDVSGNVSTKILIICRFLLENSRDADSAVVFGAASFHVFNRLQYWFAEDSVAGLSDEEVVFDADAAEVFERLEIALLVFLAMMMFAVAAV